MKIVLVKNIKYGYESVEKIEDIRDLEYYTDDDRFPISDVIEVEFKMLDKVGLIEKEVAAVDKKITKTRADSESLIIVLEQQKAELLCITHDCS